MIRPYKKRMIFEIFDDLIRILTKKTVAIFVGADIMSRGTWFTVCSRTSFTTLLLRDFLNKLTKA